MQKDQIIERVNIAFGYGAIRRLEIRHTSYDSFNKFMQKKTKVRLPTSEVKSESWQVVKDIENDELRIALYELGKNVLAQDKQ